MIYFAWIVVLGSFVHSQTLSPRSVNVALETVLEFDGKHNSRDINAIDKLQNYLNRIKKILNNNDESRRSLPRGFKFRDFLKSALRTVASYEDNDILDVVATINTEIRKYHYKGCRFFELVDNQKLRRDMAERLSTLNDLTAKNLRVKLKKAGEAIETNTMTEQKMKMLEYLDSVYVGDDINKKMELLVTQLEQFKKRSKRNNINLAKVVYQGLKSIIFDHYTNLNPNARKELKHRFETFWHDIKNSAKTKDVWRKALTTKPFSVSVNNFAIVYPKKDIVRSKPIKKTKRNKIHLEPRLKLESRLKTDMTKLQRARKDYPKKEMPKNLLRKKTNRFKKYKNKDKLHTLKPTPALMTDLSKEDDSVDHRSFAAAIDSMERTKSRFRLAKNRKKLKRGQHTRKHKYVASGPSNDMQLYFKKSRRSNEYEDNTDEGLHIQSLEKHKSANSLRRGFADYSCDDSTGDSVKTTAATTNVLHRIDNIEKVLGEIKNLVSLRRSANELDEEKMKQPKPITTKMKETESTVTTTQTTKITLPVTETTTRKITTEESTMKYITEAFKSKPQRTEATKAPKSNEEYTNVLTDTETKSSKNILKNKTESTSTTKTTQEMTSKNTELKSTVKTTLMIDLISNDTRRSKRENLKDKSRSWVSDLGDIDKDKPKTKRSNDNLKDIVKDKLKSIKEHDLNDKNRERKFNDHHLNNNFKDYDIKKIGKYHEFPDVKHSKEHDLNDHFDEFVSDKLGKDSEFPDMEGMQKRRSNDNLKDFDKEDIKFRKGHDPMDSDHHNIHDLNDDLKKHDKITHDKEGEWTDTESPSRDIFKDVTKESIKFGNDHETADVENLNNNQIKFGKESQLFDGKHHSKDNFKDVAEDRMKFEKDHDTADAKRFSKHNLNDGFKDHDSNKMKFEKESQLIDMKHHSKDNFKDFAKDEMEFGKEHELPDLEDTHKTNLKEFKDFDDHKMKMGKGKLTDHDVMSMYESQRALQYKDKNGDDLSDVDIEHIYNETRRSPLDHILDKNSDGDKERMVREKIAEHMKNFMGLNTDAAAPDKLDIDDAYNLKEDEFRL